MTLDCISWWGTSSGSFDSVLYLFIVIISTSTLIKSSSSIYYHNIFTSNKSVWKLLVLNKNTWNHISIQTNYHFFIGSFGFYGISTFI